MGPHDPPTTPPAPPPESPPPPPPTPPPTPPEEDPLAALRAEAEALRRQNLTLAAQVDELKGLTARSEETARPLQHLHLHHIQPVRDLLVLLLIVGLVYLGYVLRPLTIPVLLALTLAYLFEPVVRRMTAIGGGGRIGRPFATLSIIISLVLLVTLPVATGIAYGTVQGVHAGRHFQVSLATFRQSIENPQDAELQRRVREQGPLWRYAREFIIDAQKSAVTVPDGQTAPETTDPLQGTGDEGGGGSSRREVAENTVILAGLSSDQTSPPVTPQPDQPQPGEPPPVGAPREAYEPISVQIVEWLDEWVQRSAASIGAAFGRQALGTGADVLRIVWGVVSRSMYLAFAAFLVLFFFFFFSVNYQRVLNSMADLIPKWKRARTLEMIRKMDGVVSGFVRGRLIIMCIQTVMFIIGYWTVGVPAPLIVGLAIGILSLVPYLSLIGIPLTISLMWLQPVAGMPEFMTTWWWVLLAPTAVYFIVQLSDDYVWTPMIQGKATDMDIPSILFAVLAGGILAGFYGVLLAIPVAACIKVLMKEAFWPRFKAWSEGRVKDFLPISRYDPTAIGTEAAPRPRD
jgi:predicted PurR-regulated permease PerM